jgi:hypothetical protein
MIVKMRPGIRPLCTQHHKPMNLRSLANQPG